MKVLTVPERLIVAADFKPGEGESKWQVRDKALGLADALHGTGVYLKVNSILRACGYDLIKQIHDRGLKVFADLKLYDIEETLGTDGDLLREVKPELLTTVCTVGRSSMKFLKSKLPDTEVLGVTILTNLTDSDTDLMYGASVEESVKNLVFYASQSVDGFICSPKEARRLREVYFGFDFTLNTPGIRPAWATVAGDDQNKSRVMTPADAIRAGADRIVVGRPIVRAENPREAVERTLEEIASAVT
jgi:orotidine-5'-phosphate decarboxylase